MSKPVFGRGGRRKRRRHRVVPPKGASALWPLTHEEVKRRKRLRAIGLAGGVAALFSMLFVRFPSRKML